jgi:hypothetical protein
MRVLRPVFGAARCESKDLLFIANYLFFTAGLAGAESINV